MTKIIRLTLLLFMTFQFSYAKYTLECLMDMRECHSEKMKSLEKKIPVIFFNVEKWYMSLGFPLPIIIKYNESNKVIKMYDIDNKRIVSGHVDCGDKVSYSGMNKGTKEDLILVHEDKIVTKNLKEIEKEVVHILVKADKKVPLGLAKVVNVAKDLRKTVERSFEFVVSEQAFYFDVPCIEPKEKLDLSVQSLSYYDDIYPTSFNSRDLHLRPRAGKFKKNSTVWIAPNKIQTVWADLVFKDVILHDNKNGEKDKDIKIKKFTKVRISNNCGAEASLEKATGERVATITYDDKKITLLEMKEDREENLMLLKSPMIYNKDPKEGWCYVNLESLTQMLFQSTHSIFGGSKKLNIANKFKEVAKGLDSVSPSTAKGYRELSSQLKETKFYKDKIVLPKKMQENEPTVYASSQTSKTKSDNKESENTILTRGTPNGGKNSNQPNSPNKSCRDNTSRLCKSATMSEDEDGSDIKILYNELNLISTIDIEDQTMKFEYDAYNIQNIPVFAPFCMV